MSGGIGAENGGTLQSVSGAVGSLDSRFLINQDVRMVGTQNLVAPAVEDASSDRNDSAYVHGAI